MSIPFVVIDLDKPRKLRFGTGAFREVEGILDRSIFKINWGNLGITEVSTLLYAGLKWEDNDITMGQVDEILDERLDDIRNIENTLAEAVMAAFPKINSTIKNVKTPAAKK
jgi:hypothetical protein